MRDLIHVLFMCFVYLMHFFKFPTMLRLPSATPEKLWIERTQKIHISVKLSPFFSFTINTTKQDSINTTNLIKQRKRKKEARQDEIQLQKNSNSRMYGRFSCHFVFTGNQRSRQWPHEPCAGTAGGETPAVPSLQTGTETRPQAL